MLNLKQSATDKLRLSLSAATHVHTAAHWIDVDSTMTPVAADRELHDLTATGDVAATPGTSNYVRNVKQFSAVNVDASASINVQVLYSNSGTEYKITPLITLLAGESLVVNGDGVWFHYDANGGVYSVGQTFAVQADMETGTSLTLVVSPGMIKYHPSSAKAWVSCGVAADIQQSFGVSSLTDNGTGDVTATWSTSFSAATYMSQVCVEMTTTTYNVSGMRNAHIRSGGRATGSCRYDCVDQTSATSLIKDPTTWHISAFGDL